MTQLAAVSRERHGHQRWLRHRSYTFAAASAVVPLVVAELPKAAMVLPLGFLKQDEDYVPAAILGLEPGRNLFVAEDGRWLGGYIPAALRGYPFRLVRHADEQLLLCVDEASGLVTAGPDGEPFFDDSGEPAEPVRQVLDFLRQVERNRVVTLGACAQLARQGLIQPWPITLQSETEASTRQLGGLHRIDEAALNALDGDALKALRDAGALALAYCQLLSMQHLSLLGTLGQAHARHAAGVASRAAELFGQDDGFEFDWNA